VETRITPYFGGYWLDEVEPSDVREWFVWLEDRGASSSAVRRAKATLSAMFADAKEEGKVRSNPVAGVRYLPREKAPPRPKPRGLTLGELDRFLAALPPSWRLFHVLLAHTGVRIGEALGLTWADVHLGDDPRIEVREQVTGRGERKPRPKSHHSVRTIPLSPELARGLADWKQSAGFTAPGDPVFPNEVGRPLDYSGVRRRVLRPAIEASGIDWPKGVAFHMFRKTAATLLHHHGKTGRQLSGWLGHHDPGFTMRTYVGEADEGLGDAEFLDELIPPGGNRGQQGATQEPGKTADGATHGATPNGAAEPETVEQP
jgi:integrase